MNVQEVHEMLEATETARNDAWYDLAMKAIEKTAKENSEFTSENVWPNFFDIAGAFAEDGVTDRRRMSGAFKKAVKNGLCVSTGRVEYIRYLHGNDGYGTVWASMVYEGSAA